MMPKEICFLKTLCILWIIFVFLDSLYSFAATGDGDRGGGEPAVNAAVKLRLKIMLKSAVSLYRMQQASVLMLLHVMIGSLHTFTRLLYRG